jgi:hypothetical protein
LWACIGPLGPGGLDAFGACFTASWILAAALGTAASGALAETDRAGEDQDSQILAALARPGSAQPIPDRIVQEQARFLLFSTTDLWRQGGFAHGGLLWAPTGLDRDGPVLKLMFGGGFYHYISGALGNTEVRGMELAGAILPGWRFVRDNFTITVFLGYDFQRHRLTPDDPSAGLRGSYVGAHRLRTLVSTHRKNDGHGGRFFFHGRAKL